VEEHMWTVKQLEAMYNTESDLCKRAVTRGVPDGLATGFRAKLKKFKKVYREEYKPARDLATMTGGGGFEPS